MPSFSFLVYSSWEASVNRCLEEKLFRKYSLDGATLATYDYSLMALRKRIWNMERQESMF